MPWYQRWRNVFRSEQLNQELDSELQYHLAELVDRLMEQGYPEREAMRLAKLRLGNYSIQKERTRDMNVASWLDSLRSDLHYGLRQLKLNPGFTAVAVISLALGVGANTAIFQLVNAIRLKTLPVKDPQQLVVIDWEKNSSRGGNWSSRSANFTYVQLEEIRNLQQAFSDVAAWSAARFNLTNGGEPRYAEGLYVSGNLFQSLGVQSTLGRTLSTSDDNTACNAGAVISYPFWQREFGGEPGVVGRKLSLDGYSVPIIGVTGPSFFGVEVGNRYDVAIPLCADRLLAENKIGRIPGRTDWWLSLMGRLKPGWTTQRATAHLKVISPSIMRSTLPSDYRPDSAKRFIANKLLAKDAGTGVSDLREQYERPLWLLMATTGLVLLIACANLANLLLARATVREPEIAVRLAMGASRWRVVRQLLAESLLLAAAGSALGVGLAMLLSRALNAFGFWAFLFGGILLYSSYAVGTVPDVGWFGYAPLTSKAFSQDAGTDFWVLGVLLAGFGSISSAINVIATTISMRCPGMTLRKMPMFVWVMLIDAWLVLIVLPPLSAAQIMLMIDRNLGGNFFNASAGGQVLLWQHFFWIFGHPEVYVLIFPIFAILSEVIPVFSRKPLFGKPAMLAAIIAIGLIGSGVWAHHMFTVGLSAPANTFFAAATMLVGIPTGIKIFNWTATMYGGKIRFKTPMLFSCGFLLQFLIAGLTGIMLATAPMDWQLHHSYFVVAHFHFTLIGGLVFGLFAGIYYWFPKATGRMMNETIGKWQFWLFVLGFNITFIPLHFAGFLGMPRRVYTYQAGHGLEIWNLISTWGVAVQVVSILLFVVNVIWALAKGEKAGDDPWDAWTLEWATSSPPPEYNFEKIPVVRSGRPLWDLKHPDDPDWKFE